MTKYFKLGWLLIITAIIVGCDFGHHKSKDGISREPISVNYSGYSDACKVVYEPFYCADKYKPKGTQTNTPIGTGFLRVGKKLYVLPPEVASKVILVEGVKEWHKEN